MKDLKVRWGSALPITVELEDTEVSSVTIIIGNTNEPLITKTAPVENLVAVLDLSKNETQIPVGEYHYQINLTYEDNEVIKLPDLSNCSGCELPLFEVCSVLDGES